jgi:O-antigen ligase
VHLVVGLLSVIATIAVPFVLAARMRRANGWRDLARPTILAGSLLLAVLVGYAALEGKTGGGYPPVG